MPDNQKAETTELSSPARAQPVKTENSKLVFWRILSSILLLAVLALGTLLYLYRSGAMDLLPDAPSPSEEPVVTYTVSCFTPQGETLSVSGAHGQTVQLPRAPEIDGYSFIGWADQDGLIAEDGTVMLEDDVSFNAVYAIAFRDESAGGSHEPYMIRCFIPVRPSAAPRLPSCSIPFSTPPLWAPAVFLTCPKRQIVIRRPPR